VRIWRRGFQAILVVSGHWPEATLSVIRASGEAFLAQHPEMSWLLLTDQEVASDRGYLHERAAGGETSLLMAIRPDLVDLSKTLETEGDWPGTMPENRSTLSVEGAPLTSILEITFPLRAASGLSVPRQLRCGTAVRYLQSGPVRSPPSLACRHKVGRSKPLVSIQ
jgi:hypothetical protein